MTPFMNSTDLTGTIGLKKAILNRIFSEGLTSIRFLRRWPGPSDSETLMRSSKSHMAGDTKRLNFGDQAFLGGGSSFSVPGLEEVVNKRLPFHPSFSLDSWVNLPGLF